MPIFFGAFFFYVITFLLLSFFIRELLFFFDFFLPQIRCSLRSRLYNFFSFFATLWPERKERQGDMRRRKNKEPPRRISEVLKVAATSSPTTQCSTIGDAVSLPCAFSAPLLSALSLPRPLPRAAGARLSLRLAQSPAATLRASVQDVGC